MILRKSIRLFAAFLFLAILILPLGTSASNMALQSSEATPSTTVNQDATQVEPPTDQIILKYKVPSAVISASGLASAMEMQRLSDAAGVPLTYVREMSGDAYVLGLPSPMPLEEVQAIADRLSALPEVEYAEPDAIMQHTLTPNDPRYTDQWHYFAPGSGHYGINAPAAWAITTGSSSIVVAVIDTGITNHVDLVGRTVPGYDFITSVATANDGNGRDSDPSDPGDWSAANECYAGSPARNSSWHGTHTAGTIGAASNNGVGVAGVNWTSKLLPVRVLGKCGGTTSDIVDAMRWSAGLTVPGVPNNANPAKVLNLSLGGSGACGTTEQNAINAIVTAGTTIVISAGNSNANASGFSPGNCNNVITVAATNRDGSRASYSNYGAVVEISAPGGETDVSSSNGVLSTLNTGTQGPLADTYTYYEGTSMAAPHVAGVASLMLSSNPTLTPDQIILIMRITATSFPVGSTCTTSVCGSGIVNAGAAVAMAPNPPNKKVYLPLVLKGYPPIPAARLSPIADTTLLEGAPTVNTGSTIDMWVGYEHCGNVPNGIARSLIRFDTSIIPSNTVIASARLYVYLQNSCDMGSRAHTVTSHRITGDWSEMGATWNNQPGFTDQYGSVAISSQNWGWYSLDVTNLVQGWVNGGLPNYGVMIRANESSGNDSARLGFMTRNFSDASYRPYLNLTYVGMSAADIGMSPATLEPPTRGDTITQQLRSGTPEPACVFCAAQAWGE